MPLFNLHFHKHVQLNRRQTKFSPTAVFPSAPSVTGAAATTPAVNVPTTSVPNVVSPVVSNPLNTAPANTVPTTVAGANTDTAAGTTAAAGTTVVAATTAAQTTATVVTAAPIVNSVTQHATTTFRSLPPGSTITAGGTSTDGGSGAPSPTSSPNSSSGSSVGGIVGGAAAAILGVAVITGVIIFFLRRRRNSDDADFNPDLFKRESVILPDDAPSPMYGNGNSRGFGAGAGDGGRNPRPPTMIERHQANYNNTPAYYATTQAYNQPYGSPNSYNDVFAAQNQQYQPETPGPANGGEDLQLYNPYYNPINPSPVASPTTASPFSSTYDERGNLLRASTATGTNASNFTRSGSMMMNNNNDPVSETASPSTVGGDYAFISRGSVTPYQAAQYAAITRQLSVEPPTPLAVNPEVAEHVSGPEHLDASQSPFVDPQQQQSGEADIAQEGEETSTKSSRVTSIPPMIPNLSLPEGGVSRISYNFPVTPSPMASSFNIAPDTPTLGTNFSDSAAASTLELPQYDNGGKNVQIQEKAPVTLTPAPAVAKRPDTLYDEGDAYGGI